MAKNCNNEQTKRDGSGQGHRFLAGLDTSLPLLDDRKPEDILLFAKHYAKLVRFYDVDEPVDWSKPGEPNENKKDIHTWEEFFSKDIAVVAASIAQYKNKIDLFRQEFDLKLKMKGSETALKKYAVLFDDIIDKLVRINKWHDRVAPDHPLKKELEIKIRSSLGPALEKLISYKKGIVVPIEEDFVTLIESKSNESIFSKDPWNINYDKIKADETIYVGSNQEQKIAHAALYVDDIFLAVLKAYKDLSERGEFYFKAAIENYPDHQPHMALFIAFLQLFKYAQKELNGLSRRHLEFYYRDVLRLHERKANPDAVYMIYELAKEASEYDLKKQTPLTAGKDATGKEMIYKTETDLVINKAKVAELKTVFQDKIKVTDNAGNITEKIESIYSAPVAKSEDGNGTPFKVPETAWPAFGYFNTDTFEKLVGQEAEIGFAIASPQLFLAEGKRKIEITFPGVDVPALNSSIEIQLSGEKEWITITKDKNTIADDTVKGYFIGDDEKIIINIPVSEQAIVAYDKKIHGEGYTTLYPIIKIVIKDASKYDLLKTASVNLFTIFVDVTGVKNLILSNDDGPIDNKKSFHPFSSIPGPGSGLIIGSKEIFSKKLDSLSLLIKRKTDSLTRDKVHQLLTKLHLTVFINVQVELFKNRSWNQLTAKPNANGQYSDATKIIDLFTIPAFTNENTDPRIDSFRREININSDIDLQNGSYGFLRVSLHFYSGIEDRNGTVIDALTLNAVRRFEVQQALSLLLETTELSINYQSTQDWEAGAEQFFHIYPFGNVEIELIDPRFEVLFVPLELRTEEDDIPVVTNYLLPQIKFGINNESFTGENQYLSSVYQQGNLYIGIEGLVLPQNLSLLFKIADGTAEDNDEEPPTINWSYLVNNKWRRLPPENIVSDSTYGLQTTGIVLIDFPEDATANNTIITKGLHWLCLSVDTNADKIPKIIDVIAQANKAIFYDQQNDPQHFRNPLPANTIAKLVTKVPEVKVITQPFESFDGKMREEGKVFYARASERLRHKHRAITSWDYEHLVLQHFPWIYKVKCLTHTDPGCLCRHPKNHPEICCCEQIAPGHVLIVPISNLRNRNAVDILKPRTGRRTLIKIEEYLKKITSPFVHVHAKNPLFEEIKTSFKVKFHTGTDKGRYLKLLNEDIVKFLSPWAFDETKDVTFGGKVYASNIINFIEEQDYVDYITCFRMIHIVKGCCEEDTLIDLSCDEMKKEHEYVDKTGKKLLDRLMTEIEAYSPRAILTSVKKHCIELIEEPKEKDDCNCEH